MVSESSPRAELTGKQQLVLQYLQYRQEAGFPPTVDEIARMVGRRHTAVQGTLAELERKGRIARNGKPRGIRVLDPNSEEAPA